MSRTKGEINGKFDRNNRQIPLFGSWRKLLSQIKMQWPCVVHYSLSVFTTCNLAAFHINGILETEPKCRNELWKLSLSNRSKKVMQKLYTRALFPILTPPQFCVIRTFQASTGYIAHRPSDRKQRERREEGWAVVAIYNNCEPSGYRLLLTWCIRYFSRPWRNSPNPYCSLDSLL